jgi:hypothetical protein
MLQAIYKANWFQMLRRSHMRPWISRVARSGLPSTNVPNGAVSLVELDAAIATQQVALDQIIAARYFSQQANNPTASDPQRAAYAQRVGRLLELFEVRGGPVRIKDRYYCIYIPAAVALKVFLPPYYYLEPTRNPLKRLVRPKRIRAEAEILMAYLPEASRTTDAELEAAIWRCKALYLEIAQLRPVRRSFLVSRIYSMLVYLLSLADSQAMPGYDKERTVDSVAEANGEVTRIEATFRNALITEARQNYLMGMLIGAIFLIILVAAIFAAFPGKGPTDLPIFGIVAAGGVGAIVSVMSRLTSNKLRVDPSAGPLLVRLAGGFRPVVGAIFGLAIFVFVQATVLPIKITVTGIQLNYFYLAIAFLAGFSERFAQDAITRAGGVVSTTPSPDETRTP